MKKIILYAGVGTALLLFVVGFLNYEKANAYGECSQYGFMATYDFLSDSCKCMSGYAFGKDILGKTSCVSVDQMCKDDYGYNARSTFSGKCECSYGYSFGKDTLGRTKCISEDDMCKDQLGYSARYDSLYNKCECGYGDIIRDGKCTNANSYCRSEHGLYASYDTSSKKCGCDSGYTLNDSLQCVKKQNNVYFTVEELDTDNKKAVIRSDYDYNYYSIEYNSGCYASSFKRYLNYKIVVNLGTDFDLDTWDKIVLQDDDETCDITRREKVSSSFSLESEEELIIYTAPIIKSNTVPINKVVAPVKPKPIVNKVNTEIKKETKTPELVKIEPVKEFIPQVNPEPVKKLKWYKKIFNWFK